MAFPAILAALGRGAGGKFVKEFAAGFSKGFKGNFGKDQGQDNGSKGGMFSSIVPNFISAQGMASKAFRQLTADITAPIDGINALAQSISKFTSLSSPGKTALLDLRIKDAYAVVGRSMEPLLDSFTKVAENIGDMFARSGPQLTRLFSTVGKSFEALGTITVKMEPLFNAAIMFVEKLVSTFNKLIGPLDTQDTLWDKLADMFARFTDQMSGFVDFLSDVLDGTWKALKAFAYKIDVLSGPITWVYKQLGRDPNAGRFGRPDSSMFSKPGAKAAGTAVRQAEVVNSADELQRRMAVQALTSQGMGEQKSEGIQIKIAIDTLHQDVMEIISIIKGKGSEFYDKLNEAYKQAIEQQTRTVVDSFNSLRMS